VRSIDAEERESALEALCAAYWKPVYKYVRLRWNRTPDAAQDLTQDFSSNYSNANSSTNRCEKKPTANLLAHLRGQFRNE